MKIILSLVILLFIVSGCSSKKRVVVETKELPVWYLNPTQSNPNNLYAVGEGENKDAALANALNAMVATLGTTISSEYKRKVVAKDGLVESYQSTSTNEVSAKVQEIRISNYEIINSKDFAFERYLVKVKSNKKKLFTSLEKELEQKFGIIQNRYMESKKYNAIKQLKYYKDSKNSTQNIKNILIVMHALDTSFKDSTYLDKLHIIENRYENLQSKISFSIGSNSDASKLKTAIADGLSIKKYKIKNINDKNHFNIYISSTTNRAKSYGFDLARSSISIKVQDSKGSVIGSSKLNITGQSTQGYKIAQENVAIKLHNMIKKEGIAKIIGLEI